ncbi:MAG: geranylgeranyl reductase family protein [Actinomycetota bacterium]
MTENKAAKRARKRQAAPAVAGHEPISDASFDAVVVGGGPGGSTAAYWLARAGRRVLVVEKSAFPREKVCGDGLTPRAVRCLEDMGVKTEGPEWARADGLRIYGSGMVLDLPWPELATLPDYGLVRTRLDFDALLLDHARDAGATVWESTSVEGPLTDRAGVVTGVEVARNGDRARVEAPVVIAADGASSRFAMSLGGHRLPSRPMGVAMRAYYRSPKSAETYFESFLELWSGDHLLPGYGWLFPLPDGMVNVGLGLLSTSPHFQQTDYKRMLEDWLAGLPPEWGLAPENRVGKPRGGPLPMGFNRSLLARPGLMVVGDAAGVVNPFNGEGIAYAMETGRLSAESADDALTAGDAGAVRSYVDRVYDAYEGYFVMGRVFARLLGKGQTMGLLTKYALPNRTAMKFAFRILGNLTDPRDGDAYDRIINALARVAPGLRAAVKG